MILDLIIAALAVGGGFFCLGASLGVLRLPDLLNRMHASTKAGTLGVGMILLAVGLAFDEATVFARAMAAFLFVLLTAPVAAHLIGRAAFRSGVPMTPGTASEPGVAEALRKGPVKKDD